MAENINSTQNPWHRSSSDPLNAVVSLAQKFRLPTEIDETAWKSRPSLQLINVLKAKSERENQLEQIKLEIQKQSFYKEAGDIINPQLIEKNTRGVEEFNSYLAAVIDSSQIIIDRLREPVVGDSIPLHVSFHSDAILMFKSMGQVLSHLALYLSALEAAKTKSIDLTEMDKTLLEITRAMAKLSRHYSAISNIRHNLNQYYKRNASSDIALN